MSYLLVEKKNRLAVHAIFETRDRAEHFLRDTVPEYIRKSYYSDKTLKANSFKIVRGKYGNK
jgi:hypothetical protein